MPFDFGGGSDMYGNTVNAAEGLKTKLKSTFGWDDATAYSHIGHLRHERPVRPAGEHDARRIWTQIRDWAKTHHIARLAFWSVNRDRPLRRRRRGEQLLRHQPEQLAVHLDHRRVHRLRPAAAHRHTVAPGNGAAGRPEHRAARPRPLAHGRGRARVPERPAGLLQPLRGGEDLGGDGRGVGVRAALGGCVRASQGGGENSG